MGGQASDVESYAENSTAAIPSEGSKLGPTVLSFAFGMNPCCTIQVLFQPVSEVTRH